MDKIHQINYQGRTFSIEESAYVSFQAYELELKNHFLQEKGGDEIFLDLQFRMAEILDQRTSSNPIIMLEDIEYLKSTIGMPSDFEREEDQPASAGQGRKGFEGFQKKLFRDKKEKLIAGVCGGIANYFAIDPLAVRVIFILFALFNIATLFALNLGVVAYIIFWIVLKPQHLEPNMARKLFRHPKDQVLGGVCGGIAEFFNTESWIIRLIFVAPILLSYAGHQTFGGMNFRFFGQGFASLSIIVYVILWFITPLAKATTDFMLLKGEPINLSTIQNTTSKSDIMHVANSGLRVFLKIVAYFVLIILLLVLIPTALSVLGVAVYSYSLVDIVLFSTANKILAVLVMLLFVLLPLIGILVWIIRRILGYKSAHKGLRLSFVSLHTIGWVAFFFLLTTLVKDNNTYTISPEVINLPVSSDTLFVKSSDSSELLNKVVFFQLNQFDNIVQREGDSTKIKAVRLHYQLSDDTVFKVKIEKSAFGKNRDLALNHSSSANFTIYPQNNTLYIDPYVSYLNNEPYHLQNVLVTIFYPKGKTVITAKELKNQLSHSFRASNSSFVFGTDEDRFEHVADEIQSSSEDENSEVNVNSTDTDYTEIEDVQKDIQKRNEQNLAEIEEKKREIDRSKKELEEMKEKARNDLKEAERKLEQTIENTKKSI
jgi:phage shock protein PspC (stress-responsive transcriptional regulator)